MYDKPSRTTTDRIEIIPTGSRLWMVRFLAVLLGCCIAVSLAEMAVRFLHLYSADRLIAQHPLYGVMNIPGAEGWFVRGEVKQFIRINQHGLRDDDFRRVPPIDGKRVILLGDSFISAFQVPLESTCQVEAEQLFLAATGCSLEVIAAACNGWGTRNELTYLEEEGLALRPDAIILALFPENDLLDNLGPEPAASRWPPESHHPPFLLLPGFLRYQIGTSRTIRSWMRNHESTTRRFLPASYRAEQALARGLYHLYATKETGLQYRMWKRQEELLIRMNDMAVAAGIPLYLLVVPGRLALHPDEILHLRDEWPILRTASLDLQLPRKRLSELMGRLSIPSLDLLPAFRTEESTGRNLIFRREGHWTEDGNLLAARELVRFLEMKIEVATIPVATNQTSCAMQSTAGSLQ